MANLIAPFGLRPVRHRNGAPYNGSVRQYFTNESSNLFIGDPVIQLASGANSAVYFGSPIGSLPRCKVATAGTGNAITGVVVGFFPEQATSPVYGAASAARGLWVADDPDLIFEVQGDGAATPVVAVVGGNANLQAGGGGSTATGRSSWQLVESGTVSTTAGDQLRILGIAERPNNILGINTVWEVMINNHTMMQGIVGAGI